MQAGVQVLDRLELHRRADLRAATGDRHRMAVQHLLAEDDASDGLVPHGGDVGLDPRPS